MFKLGIVTHLQIHSSQSSRKKKTYAYEFRPRRRSEEGTFGFEQANWLRQWATHGDELAFVFGAPLAPPDVCPVRIAPQCM